MITNQTRATYDICCAGGAFQSRRELQRVRARDYHALALFGTHIRRLRGLPARRAYREFDRDLRRSASLSRKYAILRRDLYAPPPPPPLPTAREMQTEGYWAREAERLGRLEKLALAAAYTYDATGQPDLRDRYLNRAIALHESRIDAEWTAAWLRDRDAD